MKENISNENDFVMVHTAKEWKKNAERVTKSLWIGGMGSGIRASTDALRRVAQLSAEYRMLNDIVKYFVFIIAMAFQAMFEQAFAGFFVSNTWNILTIRLLVSAIGIGAGAAAVSWQPLKYPLSELWPCVRASQARLNTFARTSIHIHTSAEEKKPQNINPFWIETHEFIK